MNSLKKVIIIDDSEIDRLIHSRLITQTNFASQAESFSNGKSALLFLKDKIRKRPQDLPQLIFLDLHMPIMDGWSFLKEYEKLGLNIPVVILSCSLYEQEVNKMKVFKNSIKFAPKPLSVEKLQQIQEELLMVNI